MHALIAGLPGGAEWIILLIVAVLLFGGSRLAGIGKGTGRAIREFKEETAGLRSTDKQIPGATGATAAGSTDRDDVVRVEREVKRETGDA